MKRIVFLTATRADFGKLKSLIQIARKVPEFEVHLFATGMHMDSKYGRTIDEIYKYGINNVYPFINHHEQDSMDTILSKTIDGFSNYIKEIKPDLIVIHGDRCEPLAGAIVGSLNNILVAHIEGGEVSGTIDEHIRHSISKLSHIHFVANDEAKTRLIQMGEKRDNIFVIGSPDVDVMLSQNLPTIEVVKKYYDITFDKYAILLFHPVTTEINDLFEQSQNLVDSLIASGKKYVVIYPNNDLGSHYIFQNYKKFQNNPNFVVYPSLRFEYFLVLLKNAEFIIGNSSAGIREAPYYGVNTINIGSRQNRRSLGKQIINCDCNKESILDSITRASNTKIIPDKLYGNGKSDELFLKILQENIFSKIDKQKFFIDLFVEDTQ